MEQYDLIHLLEANPVVAAVKDHRGLERCLESECGVVFILYGTVMDIPAIVDRIQSAGKAAIVHVDLIDGLSPREVAIDYVKENTGAAGIISTKAGLVRYAKTRGLLTIQRFFVFDSMSKRNVTRQTLLDFADAIEILPGVMPKTLAELTPLIAKPIIAGGLIDCKEDVLSALDAGAMAISSTDPAVWFL